MAAAKGRIEAMFKTREWNREDAEKAIFLLLATMLGLLLRMVLFPFESWDYHQFLSEWYGLLKANGGFAAVGLNIGNYMPTYLYLLAAFTYFPISALTAIKLISCAADVVLAVYVMRIVNLRFGNATYGALTYAATLFLPGVFLNSAVWGQCDAIYTAALAAFVYYLMAGKENRAVIAFAISFVFKLQAVFLAPLLLLMVLKRKIRVGTLAFIPLVYIISIFPAVLAGRNLGELLLVYSSQSKLYSRLVMGLPNLYTWIPDGGNGDASQLPRYFGTAAVLFAGAVVLFALFLLWRGQFTLSDEMLVSLAMLFAFLVPFVLPHMHERYYYPAEIFALIFAFYFPKKLYVGVVMELLCVYAECHYLFGTDFLSIEILAVVALINLIAVARHTVRLAQSERLREVGAAA